VGRGDPDTGARGVRSRVRRRFRAAARRTFHSLRVRNYRLYFVGQIVSLSGTWMQSVAQAWLVLKLTGSGVDLGVVTALQFLPILLAGPWGGVIADRVDKRRLITGTQTAAAILALALGILTVAHVVQLWMVYLIAFLLGCVNLVDNPTRQSFVMEMVGREDVPNAVSLNSVVVNAARIVGPAVLRDGGGGGNRRPRHRRQEPGHTQAPGRLDGRVRRGAARGGHRAAPGHRDRRHAPARRRQHRVHRHLERPAPARRQRGDAGPRHGVVHGGVPGVHADRRSRRRVDRAGRRSARRAG